MQPLLLSAFFASLALNGELLGEESVESTRTRACAVLIEAFEDKSRSQAHSSRSLISKKDELTAWAFEHSNNPTILYAAGLACLMSEDVREALPYLEKAYITSRHNPAIGNTYSLALKIGKQPMKSMMIARQISEENPESPLLSFSYAMQLQAVQDYKEAIVAFKKSLEGIRSRKERAIVYGRIGICELYQGQHQLAISLIEQAEKVDSGDVRRLVPYAEAYIKSGRTSEAKDVLRRLLKINGDVPGSLYWTAFILEAEGKPNARKYYRKALVAAEESLVEDSGAEHYLLFQICSKLGDNHKAEMYKKQAAELHFTFEAPWKEE